MTRVLAVCGFGLMVAAASAQTGLSDSERAALVRRVQEHARSNFERLPNYVCMQTVERSQKRPRDKSFRPSDTMRLEVAVIGDKELFAREGRGEFNTEMPRISTGAFGTGSFSGLARNLFVHDVGGYAPRGAETRAGRQVFRFEYEIPVELQVWLLGYGNLSLPVGERGNFWVDAKTLDLLEIEDNAADIPPELHMRAVKTAIRYERVEIGLATAILPKEAEMLVTETDGRELRNISHFSGCREYRTESTITFDDPSPAAGPKKQ